MERIVEKGRTLLVSGPASITLMNGRMRTFGADITPHKKVVIRGGKTLPFETEENSIINIAICETSSIEEVAGSTIPDPWKKINDEVLSQLKPYTVMTLGGVDCGKTSFCTFLANQAVASGYRTVIIDADLGQSDIGPPATIGLGLVQEPVIDPFYLKAKKIFFVGTTNPRTVTQRIIEGFSTLKQQTESIEAQFIIINTDGWIQGEEAAISKTSLIKNIRPQAIIGLQRIDELDHIIMRAEGEGFKVYRLNPSPSVIKTKGREVRKEMRAQGYKKFLRDNTLRCIPMNWVQLEYTLLGNGARLNANRLDELEEFIGCNVIYCEDTLKEMFVVIKEEDRLSYEDIKKLEKIFNKTIQIVIDGSERGLLVGLLDQNRQFLGLGVLSKVDYEKKKLRLFTTFKERVSIVQFGLMKIDRNGKELGVITKSLF